jgi:hypothetical protein
MASMRSARAWVICLLASGCASGVAGSQAAPGDEPLPDVLAGFPVAVTAGRALFDLDSGDPDRVRRARCVLLALPEGPGLDGLRERAAKGPPGTSTRLEALAILAERGDPLDGSEGGEVVAMCLRELGRQEPTGRSCMLALDRLRGMGRTALPLLREESRPGSPYAEEAARALRVLFGESPDHRLREAHP